MDVWISSRFIFFGTAVTGAALMGGVAFHNAMQKDNEAIKQVIKDGDGFWNEKVGELEKELVKLKREGNNKDKELTTKIVKDVMKNAFFDLDNDGNGFKQKDKTSAQRIALASFCKDSTDRNSIDPKLAKRLCDKITK